MTTQQAQLGIADQQPAVDRAVAALVRAATSPSSGTGSGGTGTGTTGSDSPSAAIAGSGTSSSGNTATGTTGAGASGANRAVTPTGSSSTNAASGSNPGGGPSTLTVASADAALTKAELGLTTAKAQLEAATMTAPISGVVSAVPFTKGDTASASDEVVIVGKGSVSVEMAVSEAAFRTLEVGQAATITETGAGTVTGKVTRLGLLPTESTTGSATTYPVTVVTTDPEAASLPAGGTASVVVTLSTRLNVLVVPVSAVTRSGTAGTVQVLDRGTVTRTKVTLGAIGSATMEVSQGLTAGQTLVIADNSTALPTNSSNRGLRTSGTGGFAGGTGAAPPVGGAPTGGR